MSRVRSFPFVKMDGAGNDFVVLEGAPPELGQELGALVRAFCHRRRGAGADGALWIERLSGNDEAVFRMHFFNRDGRRVNLCLNGSRCVALRAVELGWATGAFRFRTELSMVEAEVHGDGRVSLRVDTPELLHEKLPLPEGSPAAYGWALNTGDPHLVLRLEPVAWESMDFDADARALRHWDGNGRFDAGNNVHFVRTDTQPWRIRSFERGVEAETWACGSGCLASAVSLAENGRASLLTVAGDLIELREGEGHWTLTGPARRAFDGKFHWDGKDVEIN